LPVPVALAAFLDWLRSRLWFIPGLFALAAIVAAFVLVPVDRLLDRTLEGAITGVVFAGGPDSARSVLSTIAAAMLTFTGVVYSITMLVLQLASSQLSPRVMRTFLRDRVNQGVLGLFVATFLYALLVLREVRSPADGPAFVPAIAVTGAYLLLITSVAWFIVYIHHMAQAIRAATVLRSVGDETRGAIRRLYPEGVASEPERPVPGLPARPPDRVITLDRAPGVVTAVDAEQLVGLAREHRLTIELVRMIGDFVPTGAPLLRVWSMAAEEADTGQPTDDAVPAGALAGAIHTGVERTMTQDAAFGFRQIVDIGERALSPGVNDPTTAVQAIDELHDLLRRLVTREIPSPVRVSGDGMLLVLPRPGWDDYVSLALDEIRQYGASSIQVARRLRYLLLDLRDVAPSFRHAAIDRQLRLLDASLAEGFDFREDRRAAALPSPSGQGPAAEPVNEPDQDSRGEA
jgi:uncharacterized membrane protein